MFFKSRAQDNEIMDLGPSHYSISEYRQCLRQLDRIGRFLGGDQASFQAFKRLNPESILDVGCGGGTFTNRLGDRFPNAKVLGVDISQDAIQSAKKSKNVDFQCVSDLSFPTNSFDVVTSTLVCHHLDEEKLIYFLKESYRIAKKSVILNDLHRHLVAYGLFFIVSRLFFRNRLVMHDGLISIKKSFVKEDWITYVKKANIPFDCCSIKWHFPFRWIVKINK